MSSSIKYRAVGTFYDPVEKSRKEKNRYPLTTKYMTAYFPEMDLCSASSLKQQSAGRHVAPLGHITLIPSQPVFALSP